MHCDSKFLQVSLLNVYWREKEREGFRELLKLNADGTDVMVKLYPPCSSSLRDAVCKKDRTSKYTNIISSLGHKRLFVK